VIGGVMGTNVVRYDIYGPDVLITNKMESNGKKGSIQVSETTKELLENNFQNIFEFETNGIICLPSINREIKGYFIIRIPDDSFDDEDENI
jgi:class 3 adenylate cyclase